MCFTNGFPMTCATAAGPPCGSRRDVIYPYFVCSGRHGKYTDCTFRAVLIDSIERKVEDLHADYRLEPEFASALEHILIVEFESVRKKADEEEEYRRGVRIFDIRTNSAKVKVR